jgi:D-alanine-D-alanine ligase
MSVKKIRVGVLFGGRSGEHEVSIVSATSIMNVLDPAKYEIIPIGITKTGQWIAGKDALPALKNEIRLPAKYSVLTPDPEESGLVAISRLEGKADSALAIREPIDVMIPVLHGTYGEDGCFQGLAELSGIPYVGPGVLGSAVCMDKVVQKQVCLQAGIPAVDYLWFHVELTESGNHGDIRVAGSVSLGEHHLAGLTLREVASRAANTLGLPLFVKPANSGSSVGVGRAKSEAEIVTAIVNAARIDNKILIETGVSNPREIECAVLGNLSPKVSVAGEIIPSNDFYDYDSKYVDGASTSVIPADIPQEISDSIRQTAIRAFIASGCEGMARVDFLLSRETNKFYLNELNTIPGFTSISMYPKLWEATGLVYPDLLDTLIQLAVERHTRRAKLETSFTPKKSWHRGS